MALQKINFVKMHGLGNDFVIVNQEDLAVNCNLPQKSSQNLSQLAMDISNRYTGIGCDQFIIYTKKTNAMYSCYEMIIYNQDGSKAKLCGNASRCLAKLIYLNTGQKNISLKVDNRELSCQILGDNEITVDIGQVSFDKEWMPISEKIWPILERYTIDLKEVICVDVGNPHFIIFSNLNDQDKDIIGRKLQEKELFADGVNVNFALIKDNKIYLSVWERGAGLTLACGSGACASFAAANKLGFIRSACEVIFPLGSLKMSKKGDNIIMTGPATLVALGEFFYD
jgi:diaminopimelate epimerase